MSDVSERDYNELDRAYKESRRDVVALRKQLAEAAAELATLRKELAELQKLNKALARLRGDGDVWPVLP